MHCPHCSTVYSDEHTFCPMDGQRLVWKYGEAAAPSSSPGTGADKANQSKTQFRSQLELSQGMNSSGEYPNQSGVSWGQSPSPQAQIASVRDIKPAARPDPQSNKSGGASSTPGSAHQPANTRDLRSGEVLGERYRIDSLIGSGGMGHVYSATHILIERRVAIKVLRADRSDHPELAQRFTQEARLVSRLKHPNIVDIFDFGVTPTGSPYFVMEYLSGESLADRMDREHQLDPNFVLGLMKQILRGLQIAHQHQVVHRDLKPENVFLCDEGDQIRAKLLDFGIARAVDRKTRLTAAGVLVGTPEYMSPEQARGEEVDGRADLYALGVMCFEMLAGQVPYQGNETIDTLRLQIQGTIPKLVEVNPKLKTFPFLETLNQRILAKRAEDRFQSARELLEYLATIDRASDRNTAALSSGDWSEKAGGSQATAEGFDDARFGGKPPAVVPPSSGPIAASSLEKGTNEVAFEDEWQEQSNRRWLQWVGAGALTAGLGIAVAVGLKAGSDEDPSQVESNKALELVGKEAHRAASEDVVAAESPKNAGLPLVPTRPSEDPALGDSNESLPSPSEVDFPLEKDNATQPPKSGSSSKRRRKAEGTVLPKPTGSDSTKASGSPGPPPEAQVPRNRGRANEKPARPAREPLGHRDLKDPFKK